jgi:hypothetical protein
MRWLVLYRHEDAEPEAYLSPPPPHPHSAWPPLRSAPPPRVAPPPPPHATPPPPVAAPAPPPPQSPVLHRQRCPPPPPPAASCSPPEKMRCKEVSNFILEKWYENERLPHLSVSGSMNPPMMGLCVSSSLLGVYWQYKNPEKGCSSTMPCYYSFLQRASS